MAELETSVANAAEDTAIPLDEESEFRDKEYAANISRLRKTEYSNLTGIYLDHAGTTPIPKSLLERFTADLSLNVYGNPHSGSPSSQLATRKIETIRHDALRFFNADPRDFDLVFVANATAGIKLVGEALRDQPNGFKYNYHCDSHTSLVGLREWAVGQSRCFGEDSEVEDYLTCNDSIQDGAVTLLLELLAYPAQSNMNGRRLPLHWCARLRNMPGRRRYSLLDAAALVSTSPLDLSDVDTAPDFVVLSFYKIFGFPDLGALIVRKDSSGALEHRRYFGGGTVDATLVSQEQWHAKKTDSIHVALEDGTLPIHSILALGHAMAVHAACFGNMDAVSRHSAMLSRRLFDDLDSLRHENGRKLCKIYTTGSPRYGDASAQGPIIAFNMVTSQGAYISNTEVEKLAAIHDIHLRIGGLCNPGGTAAALNLGSHEVKANFACGVRCGGETDIVDGKPTGMIRVSLAGISTAEDVAGFVAFIRDFFVERHAGEDLPQQQPTTAEPALTSEYCIESLLIYPIKSCAGWRIPSGVRWPVRAEGLAWDREFVLVHRGTTEALSQKRYPRIALVKPEMDLAGGVLRIRCLGREVCVPLSMDSCHFEASSEACHASMVCGDAIRAQTFVSREINDFFTEAIGVPCVLARLHASDSTRHAKAHLQRHQMSLDEKSHTAAVGTGIRRAEQRRPLLLSNESPVLIISRPSLNWLNEQIKARGGKAAQAEAFRPNIVVAQNTDYYATAGVEEPYVEDGWRALRIAQHHYEILGSCRRCQMVCIDQDTAERNREPFATLAKTRRFEGESGRVYFGQHACLLTGSVPRSGKMPPTVAIGDAVAAFKDRDAEVILEDAAGGL